MMARAFLLAALLAVAAAPVVRAQTPIYDNPDTIPMNAKGKYAREVSGFFFVRGAGGAVSKRA